MQEMVINKKRGCLLKDLHLDSKTISFLQSKNLIEELSLANKGKYKDTHFVLEEGIILLKLDDLQERYNILKEYLTLQDKKNLKSKEFILENMKELNSIKIDLPKEMVLYEGQIYDMNFIKKYFEIIKNNVYDNGILVGKLVKNKNIYTLKKIT